MTREEIDAAVAQARRALEGKTKDGCTTAAHYFYEALKNKLREFGA